MIRGLGIDIIDVTRIKKVLARHGTRFLAHVFTGEEQDAAPKGEGVYAYYAGRWAAKEAVAKALGTGIGERCAWHDLRIRNDSAGRPVVELSGRAAETAKALGAESIHITISHERSVACAAAVAEGG